MGGKSLNNYMSALLVHRRSSLLCYFSDRDGGISIPIPPEAMSDMEILKEDVYLRVVSDVVAKMHPPTSVTLVLADDMCYFAQTTAEKLEEVKKQLVDDTPFSHVETTVVRNGKQVFIIATNADIYETAVKAFSEKGITISMVLPWSALVVYKVVLTGEIDRVTVKRVTDSAQVLRESAFPLMQHEKVSIVPTTEHALVIKRKSIPIGWIIFVSIAIVYSIVMIWYLLRS